MRGWILATVLVAKAAFGDAAIPGGEAGKGGETTANLPALSTDGKRIAVEGVVTQDIDARVVEIRATDGSARMIASTWINGSMSPEQQWQHVVTFLRKQGSFTPLLETKSCPGVVETPKRNASCTARCLPAESELTFYKTRDGRTVVASSTPGSTIRYYLQPKE
jgi:hypothetical protein